MRIATLIALITLNLPAWAESPFAGNWRINLEETDKVAVKFKEGSGMMGNKLRTTGSVMGLPLPSRYKQSAMSSLPAKDPQVLTCTDMGIELSTDRIALRYDRDGKETLRKGEYRGRKSSWSKTKIEQKYKTPERRVRKTWSVRDDGRLFVSVKINPTNDRARTYNRVFDRVTEAAD